MLGRNNFIFYYYFKHAHTSIWLKDCFQQPSTSEWQSFTLIIGQVNDIVQDNKKQPKQAENNPQNHINGSSKPKPNHTNALTKPMSISTKFFELVNLSNPLPQNQNSPQNPKINHWHENHKELYQRRYS